MAIKVEEIVENTISQRVELITTRRGRIDVLSYHTRLFDEVELKICIIFQALSSLLLFRQLKWFNAYEYWNTVCLIMGSLFYKMGK